MSVGAETVGRSRAAIDVFAAVVMVGLTFSWGLNGVAAKLSNQGFNPIFVSVARAAIGSVLVFLWCRWRGIALFERDGTLLGGIVAGMLFGAEFVLIFVGLDYTSVARSALMVNTMPFWALIGSHFLLGERMNATKFAGLALAFSGVVLVFFDKLSLPGPDAIIGDVMSLAAGVVWAATTIAIRLTQIADARPEKVLLYQLVVGTIMTAPLIPLGGAIVRDFAVVPTAALLFQAIYVVAVTYVIWFWLVGRYAAAGLSSFAFLTPAFGVLCGGLILGEPVSPKLFASLALIGAGLIIVNRPARTARG